MFENLKSRLGFADDETPKRSSRGNRSNDQYDVYDDEYADEGDFGEYGDYADEYADEFAEYGPDYDDGASHTYESPREKVQRSSFKTTSSARGAYRNSNLVTIDDVKAHTATSGNLDRDPLAPRTTFGGRTVVDERKPAPQTPVAQMAAASASEATRSEGLNSLFTPTTDESASFEKPAGAHASFESSTASRDSYAPSSPAKPASARGISVLKPVAYEDAERITKSLKSGDAVVISLRNTPDNLFKRILDFSFGVASALDATVDCPGEKVFAITCGAGLSDAEKQALINQGVI